MRRRDFGMWCAGIVTAPALGAAATAPDAAPDPSFAADPAFVAATGLTEQVAAFSAQTAFDAVPRSVIELGKKSILDGLGLALAGQRAETAGLALAYVAEQGTGGTARILGTSRRTSAQLAALVNGIAIHADDFDDTQLAAAPDRVYGLLTHPTVAVLPALLALAPKAEASGRDLTVAYHVGVEVECKIAEAIAPRHYEEGFHSTATCGPFGAAAACARLLRLDVGKTRTALGIVASRAAGLRENFGTMTKPLQAGHAAQAGVEAAQLAQLGWTAADNVLEAERGFFRAEGGTFDPTAIVHRLGSPWSFASPGVSIKPFPSGSLSHPAMTAMVRLIAAHDIRPEQVEQVEVGTNHAVLQALLRHRPQTGLEAKFSLEFCLAILLLERRAGLTQFTTAVVQRADVQAMLRRVRVSLDPKAEAAGYDKMRSLLRVTLRSGAVLSGEASFAKGSPVDPMSFDEVAVKFRDCAQYAGWAPDRAETIIALVRNLEAQPDLERLGAMLAA